MNTNTYTKLKSGNWGIRATRSVSEGDRVTVTKRDGTTKFETIAKIVWTDGTSAWLCAIAPSPAPVPRPRRAFRPCGYPGCSQDYCDECDGQGFYA